MDFVVAVGLPLIGFGVGVGVGRLIKLLEWSDEAWITDGWVLGAIAVSVVLVLNELCIGRGFYHAWQELPDAGFAWEDLKKEYDAPQMVDPKRISTSVLGVETTPRNLDFTEPLRLRSVFTPPAAPLPGSIPD